MQNRQGGESVAAANSQFIRFLSSVVKMLGRSQMRAGKILKEGGFDCGSNRFSASLRLLLLVLFLQEQEKYIIHLHINTQPCYRGWVFCLETYLKYFTAALNI